MTAHIYIISTDVGLTKIGASARPHRRVTQVGQRAWGRRLYWLSKQGWPLHEAIRIEGAIHWAHRARLEYYEWFAIKPETAAQTARRIIRAYEAGQPVSGFGFKPPYHGRMAVTCGPVYRRAMDERARA